MNPDKQIIIDEIYEQVNASPFVIVTDYTGVTVDQFTDLREKLRATGARCQVAKNTFVKRALKAASAPDDIAADLTGQTAIITGESDICAAAKVLKDFAKVSEKPQLKSGILDGKYLSPEDLGALADLPPRDVLLSQLLSTLMAPAGKLVRTLNEPGASLARLLQAKSEKEG
ncbi:MAG: large subunit ribosomal protein L10 [Verrucomicrobiales bacterium]|jgi:large subunit ribosomal protein L10